ncbi:MAG TPA: hypothetical protein VNM90_27470 [Haliangium sp.]|nr:hypothetical protein [Haliangium sp.]
MRRRMSRIALPTAMVLGLTALGTAASAQPRLSIPEGVTTDRFSADPWAASIDLGFTDPDEDDAVRYAVRADLYGQILGQAGAHRVGGYAALPYARLDPEGGEDAIGKLGHLELGGLFTTAAGPTTDAVLRGGVAFEVSDDDEFDSLVLASTSLGRLSEASIGAPGVTWARLSGSLLHRSHPYFARGDFGVDVPFGQDGADPFVRLDLAAGVDFQSVALLGELANLVSFDGSDEETLLSTFAVTLRVPTGTLSPALSVVIPLDDALQELVDFVVVVGVRAAGGG